MIRVLRGNPTPEELAAALAVVRARAAASSAAGEAGGSGRPTPWSDPARTVPTRLPAPGPDAWRTSFWPA
ncbi:acyl-CoA carboxylase subunit epsilon [Streptomyces calidiresistens]|uniref:Acyl-CoA carboxylase subunit epsilon n=1 Tax=Streptomyces calidiresistens TaxID=1485586 RepID=A0A7W3XX19_9ACTN|nr:acyl-CoA carboxylase epsilon subunit [Streptomyces calidiresistens]MBB0230454.1 acyl-CoA carboxylase subunit epsilon [Streptomyces calidiresistens]